MVGFRRLRSRPLVGPDCRFEHAHRHHHSSSFFYSLPSQRHVAADGGCANGQRENSQGSHQRYARRHPCCSRHADDSAPSRGCCGDGCIVAGIKRQAWLDGGQWRQPERYSMAQSSDRLASSCKFGISHVCRRRLVTLLPYRIDSTREAYMPQSSPGLSRVSRYRLRSPRVSAPAHTSPG